MMCISKMSIPPHNFQIHSDGPYFALRQCQVGPPTLSVNGVCRVPMSLHSMASSDH